MKKSETATLHFDLSHCPQGVAFTLQAGGGKRYRLTAYQNAPGKMDEHRKLNKALAVIPRSQLHRLTHFVEDLEMDADAVSVRRVVYPSIDEHPLPEIAVVFVNIPTKHRKRAIRRNATSLDNNFHPITLAHFGVAANAVNSEEMDEICVDADKIKSPLETAKSIVFHHPEIGSVNPIVARTVLDHHVKHTQDFQDLVEYIENHTPDSQQPWYQKTWATWINPDTDKEEPIPAKEDLKFRDGKKAKWPTNPDTGKPSLPLYDLTDEFNTPKRETGVLGAAQKVVYQVLKETKNDETLNGQLWTKQHGTTQKIQTNVESIPSPQSAGVAAAKLRGGASTIRDGAKGFAIKNTTSSFGLNLYDNELKFDQDTEMLSFPVKNWMNRALGVYVEFFKTDGSRISRDDNWDHSRSNLMKAIAFLFGDRLEPSDTQSIINIVTAGNQVFGVPCLTNPATLEFTWPKEASRATVLFGGFGAAEGFRDWDKDVDMLGSVLTAILSYGLTFLLMCLTVSGLAAKILQGLWKKAPLVLISAAAGLGIFVIFANRTKWAASKGLNVCLSEVSKKVVGIVYGQLGPVLDKTYQEAQEFGFHFLEEMRQFASTAEEAFVEIEVEEATEAVPYAGWALKVAAVTSNLAALTATRVELVLSPSTYMVEILRTMELTVTVKPDPTHDEDDPVWPLVGDHYVIQVRYPKGNGQEGGTTYTKTGPMRGISDQPIVVKFEQIPAGGKIEVVANIYSDNNWLAGRWHSGWLNADPDESDQLNVAGNIKENLVPLTADTSYSQKRRLAYSKEQNHFWQVTKFSIPDTLAGILDRGHVDDKLRQEFKENHSNLSSKVTVSITSKSRRWKLVDQDAGVTYSIIRKQISNLDGEAFHELGVQNETYATPGSPEVINDCGPDGHRLCERKNITINDMEHQLGYAWRASGQNLPRDYDSASDNGQMFGFQSISTLGEPQESIIEPSRGFSNPTYIAFNQFGLTPIFDLNPTDYKAVLNHGGAVPEAIITEFAKFSLVIPKSAQVTVSSVDKAWKLGLPGQDPLFSLRMATVIKDAQKQEVINVYSWPVPRLDNFYLDSRTYTTDNPIHHLRSVAFVPGQSNFDYETNKSWGCFRDVTIKDLAVHPHGYVIGADYDNHKLLVLRLPAEAVDEKDAPIAMPLSGEGLREGLLNQPVALTITPDGRILILEEGNNRVQAFDVKGNPVPCFLEGSTPFAVDAKFISDLDSRNVAEDLIQAFQMKVIPELAPLFSLDLSSVAALNDRKVDAALSEAFLNNGYAQQQEGEPQFSVTVTQKDALWLVTDCVTQTAYDVRVMADRRDQLLVFHCFAIDVGVKASGREWLVMDRVNAMTFEVTKHDTEFALIVQRLVSTMPLREEREGAISYMDMAVESKGYIYVLSRRRVKDTASEYRLDIYSPNGTPLLEEPQAGVNAAKLTVDQWRSLFTLNFDKLLGPNGRTEPGVSEWMPSTPGKPSAKA